MAILNVNGINLYYELHGPEKGDVLVLNNGIIMNAATSWVFQTKTLAAHYRVLHYDCRGQGQSDHPEGEYTMELHADDLALFLDALDIPSAHIAGISYGGEVAQAFALKYPGKTRALILIDTVSEIRPELAIITHNWMDALDSKNPLIFFNATVPWNFSPAFIRNNGPLLEDAKKRYALLDFSAVHRLCESFLKVNFTSQLHDIETPACIIVGEHDILKGPDYAEILREHLPHSEYYLLKNAGHATCWEAPEELNSIILGFLAKH